MAREHCLNSLPDDGVFIYLDWAMKWLPTKYREPQSYFFGKRGLSWHIAVAIKKIQHEVANTSTRNYSENESWSDEEDPTYHKPSFSQKFFVHVFDSCFQDSSAVLCTIENVLREIHLSDPMIKTAFFRSDNAGCYHGGEALLSLPSMAKNTGITVQRVDFSDPQGGKSPCDRFAAVLKTNVRRYLNEKNDVTNASEFVNACRSNGGIVGVKVSESRLILESNSTVQFKFPGVTNYNNFKFEKDGILAHRAWNVGAGKFFPFKDLKSGQKNNKLDCEQQSGFIHEWAKKKEAVLKATKIAIMTKSKDKEKDFKLKSSVLFECSEEGCIKKFLNYNNLVHHLATGNHVRKPERRLLTDTAMQLYQSKLERIGNEEMISLMLETSNIENTIKFKEKFETDLREGWALLKERKNVRLNAKQIEFLLEKFDESVQTSTRWKPEVLVTIMHELKVNGKFYFTASEFLTASQIRSFFSREKAKHQKFKLNENDSADQENEFFQDDLALQEILDREALHHNCKKAFDEEEQSENSVQLTRGVKHNASCHDLSDKRRSSFRKRKL